MFVSPNLRRRCPNGPFHPRARHDDARRLPDQAAGVAGSTGSAHFLCQLLQSYAKIVTTRKPKTSQPYIGETVVDLPDPVYR
jgi:hypothetical protein